MAIRGSGNIMLRFLILSITLHQTASFPTSVCYKIPPSNYDPPILNTYRKRFSFVLKSSNGSTSTTRSGSTGSAISENCPWQWVIDDKLHRFPRIIVYAKCDKCDQTVCKPVTFSHKVLYEKCDYKTGEMVWRWASEELNVAFIYTRKV